MSHLVFGTKVCYIESTNELQNIALSFVLISIHCEFASRDEDYVYYFYLVPFGKRSNTIAHYSGVFYPLFMILQNIFHGAMALDQLYTTRPTPKYSGSRTPIQGLYLCGSGAHPGE